MKKRSILVAVLISACLYLSARPVRTGVLTLTQPDGSRFNAVFMGDEFMKIKMTEAGEAIIQNTDGWWCYAVYDAQGQKMSTGVRVGTTVPANALAESRNIPYDVLSHRAAVKRRVVNKLRVNQDPRPPRLKVAGEGSSEKAGIVILAQFAGGGEKFKYKKTDFEAMLTQEGYSKGGATGSAKQYFDDQFNGLSVFSFDVSDIVTLSREREYYGGNDSNGDDKFPHKMVMEACKLADDKIDFKKYDQDGDREVDNVFVFFAGLDEASGAAEDHIWSHAWYIKDGAQENLVLDGVVINRYACSSELEGNSYEEAPMAGIGTFCHEYSHTLGLPDFYDCDYNEGKYAASLWQYTSLMDGGNYNNEGNTPPYYNAMEREILGLSAPIVITQPGTYEMSSINEGVFYRINTTTENEYFLLEYRDGSVWDKYIGGSGVLVYHIDKSDKQRWELNQVNSYADHQCADLIEADGRRDVFDTYTDRSFLSMLNNLKGLFFPYSDKNSLTPISDPGLKCWNQTHMPFAITDIQVKNGKATFNVVSFSGESMPKPENIKIRPFQDSAIITFECNEEFSGEARVEFGLTGDAAQVIYVKPYETGKWALDLSGLKPLSSYALRISFVSGDAVGDSVDMPFMTKKGNPGAMPYIYLTGVERNKDGSFPADAALPLKVYNAYDAKEIHWKFDGNTIKQGKDMLYHLQSSGKLEAYVVWEDGSEDVIIKEIRVK